LCPDPSSSSSASSPRAVLLQWTRTLLEKIAHQHYPAPSPRPKQPKSAGPPVQCPPPVVQPTSPLWRPHLDDRPVGPNRVAVQGAGRKFSLQAATVMSTSPPTSGIWQLARPQFSPRRFHWVCTQVPTPRQRTPPCKAWKALRPSRCGGGQRPCNTHILQ
jgi:hypothetical protein